MSRWALGIDLGGTSIKASVVGEDTGLLSGTNIPTAKGSGPGGIIMQLSAIVADLYRSASVTLDPADFTCVGLGGLKLM